MAIQPPHKKQPGAQINRTPAPKLDLKTGGEDYGQANAADAVAALPPGVGGPQTKLGKNLRESVDDPVADEILAHGISGRGDQIPADGDDYQLRQVSGEMYPASYGHVRQQDPDKVFGKASSSLPSSETDNETEPERKPS